MALSLEKDKIRFLLLEGLHDNALKVLKDAGYHNIENISHALDQDELIEKIKDCLLYTSPSPRDRTRSRMPSSA